ncbi:MAG: hypothetical protein GXZ11_07150 [Tissierellia bacterium]|nr:hypothetical protein [Tissierellia bacterium]
MDHRDLQRGEDPGIDIDNNEGQSQVDGGPISDSDKIKEPLVLDRGQDEGVPIVEKSEFKQEISREYPKKRRVSSNRSEGVKEVEIVFDQKPVKKKKERVLQKIKLPETGLGKSLGPLATRLKRNPKILLRWGVLLGLLIILIALIGRCSKGTSVGKHKTLEVVSTVWGSTEEIESLKYSEKGLRFWDRNNLAFYDVNGTEERLLNNPQMGRVFFIHDLIYAVNHLTQDITIYDQKGNQAGYVSGGGHNVFRVNEAGQYVVVHRKTGDGEVLDVMDEKGTLTPLIALNEFILCYDMQSEDDYVVGSLVTKEQGYRSRVTWTSGKTVRNYDFENEVVIKLFLNGNDIYAVTNENIYWLRNENKVQVEVNLVKQAIWDDNKIWVLHGDVLESFNRQLVSTSKVIPAIGSISFMRDKGINYVYSGTEIAGYYAGQETPGIYYKTDFTINDIQAYGDIVAIVYGDHVDLSKLVDGEPMVVPGETAEEDSEETPAEENTNEDSENLEEATPDGEDEEVEANP